MLHPPAHAWWVRAGDASRAVGHACVGRAGLGAAVAVEAIGWVLGIGLDHGVASAFARVPGGAVLDLGRVEQMLTTVASAGSGPLVLAQPGLESAVVHVALRGRGTARCLRRVVQERRGAHATARVAQRLARTPGHFGVTRDFRRRIDHVALGIGSSLSSGFQPAGASRPAFDCDVVDARVASAARAVSITSHVGDVEQTGAQGERGQDQPSTLHRSNRIPPIAAGARS